jgi:CBS domain containing-hemolysin-like protein
MLTLAVAILIMLLGSALCSGAEAALLSVSLLKAQQLVESRKPAALTLLAIRQKVNRPIITIRHLQKLISNPCPIVAKARLSDLSRVEGY